MIDFSSVFEQDDYYFKEHQDVSEYIRVAVPGEFGGAPKLGEGLPNVLVVQFDERMRIRIPYAKDSSDGPTVVLDIRGADRQELSTLLNQPGGRTPAATTDYGAHLFYANSPQVVASLKKRFQSRPR